MRYLRKWEPFINENVQSAKAFLIKREREKILKENPGKSFREIQLTPEQENAVLQDSDFLRIKDFLQKNNKPGLTYAWVYFLKEDPSLAYGEELREAPENPEALTEITATNLYYVYTYWDSIKGKQKLKLASPEGYVNAKERGQLSDTAWNTLWDELQELLQAKHADKFIEFFPRNIRDYYRELLQKKEDDERSKTLLEKFVSYVNLLEACPVQGGKIIIRERDTDRIIHTYPNQAKYQVIKQAGKYNDFETYPDFRDSFKAFVDLLSTMKRQVESDGKPLSKSLNEIENLEPQIKILYRQDEPNMLVTSSRSFLGVQKICSLSSSTYCIKDLNVFYDSKYHNSILVHINQFDKDPSDGDYLLTMHLNKSLKITDWSNTKNRKEDASGKPVSSEGGLEKFLKRFNVPNIDAIIHFITKNFDRELVVKQTLEIIYKEMGEWSSNDFTSKRRLLNILGRFELRNDTLSKKLTPQQIQDTIDTVMQIIKLESNFTDQEIIDYYKQTGLYTFEDYKIFREFLRGDTDPEQIRKVLSDSYIKLKFLEKDPKIRATEKGKRIPVLLKKAEELKTKLEGEFSIKY